MDFPHINKDISLMAVFHLLIMQALSLNANGFSPWLANLMELNEKRPIAASPAPYGLQPPSPATVACPPSEALLGCSSSRVSSYRLACL